jgi:hypothetical protein
MNNQVGRREPTQMSSGLYFCENSRQKRLQSVSSFVSKEFLYESLLAVFLSHDCSRAGGDEDVGLGLKVRVQDRDPGLGPRRDADQQALAWQEGESFPRGPPCTVQRYLMVWDTSLLRLAYLITLHDKLEHDPLYISGQCLYVNGCR